MNNSYVAPLYRADAFHCPFCMAYAHQRWYSLYKNPYSDVSDLPDFSPNGLMTYPANVSAPSAHGNTIELNGVELYGTALSECVRCQKQAIWIKDKMIYPSQSTAPHPNEDMPDDVKADFMEAREIVEKSPRAAAALLRLALQKLTIYFGGDPNDNLYNNIHFLVKSGLKPMIQQSFDILRIVGNDAVHPGVIDVDNKETAMMLFDCLNVIVDSMITNQKNIDEFYNRLPQDKLNAVKKRDSRA